MSDLEIAPERIPHWSPGIPAGIPSVPVRADVTSFGARGDGKTDDAAAIQKAVDAVSTPGAVFMPEGTYRVTKTLRLRSGGNSCDGAGSRLLVLSDDDQLARLEIDADGPAEFEIPLRLAPGWHRISLVHEQVGDSQSCDRHLQIHSIGFHPKPNRTAS